MLQSKIDNKYCSSTRARITQGDILTGIKYKITENLEEGFVDVAINYCVVMSQDCDLQQDFDKYNTAPQLRIPNILICPAYPEEQYSAGKHVEPNVAKSTDLKNIIEGKRDRFHYLPPVDGLLPGLVIDFKHFHTIPRNVAYNFFNKGFLHHNRE